MAIREWLYEGGDYPGDKAASQKIAELADEWKTARGNGFDVVASAVIDELEELVENLRDLI